MKTGLSLEDLARKITALQTMKRDFIASTDTITMQVQRPAVQVKGEPSNVITLELPEDKGSFPILETAHDQIGARLGVPSKYYDRMRSDYPDLLAINVNTLFRGEPEKRMIRTLDGNMRSFHSNRYSRIENEEIAAVALPILFEMKKTIGLDIVSCEITERHMYIQATTPRIAGEVKLNDVVQAGVAIRNSEIGLGAVSVSPLIFRLRCLNGMICADGRLRGYHVGGRVDSDEQLWAEDTKKADDRAILLKVRDTVKAAVDEALFNERLAKMKGLSDVRVTGSPDKSIEVLAQKFSLSDGEQGSILRALIEGADLSAWGMLNAVTSAAHDAKSYDRAVEFESMGGALLELPATEWKRVLEAA